MADGKVTIQALLDASNVQKGVGNIEKSTKTLSSKLSARAVAIGNVVSSVAQTAWGHVSKFFGDAMNATDTLNKYQKSLSYVGFSQDVIDKSSAAMKKYADETVYNLDTIVQTTSILASNGVEDFEGMTESLGNLNAALGGSSESFDATSLALTQIVGAGKLASGDWRQFVSNLPASSQLLQQTLADIGAYNPAIMSFSDALSKGEISSDEFLAAIQKLGSDPSAVEAARSTDTFEGAIGNLQASLENGLMTVIDHFGMDNITNAINACTDIIDGAGDTFATLGDVLDDVFDGAVDAGGAMLDLAGNIQDGIAYISQFKDIIEPLGVFVGALAIGFGVLGQAVGLFNIFLPITTAATGAWAAITTVAGDAMAALNLAMEANPMGVIIGVIAAITAALVYFFTKTEAGRQLWAQFIEFLKAAWDSISQKASEIWGAIVTAVSTAWDGIVTTTSSVWESITTTLSSIWEGIVTTVGGFVDQVVTIATGIWESVSGAVQTGFETVKNLVTVGFMAISEVISFMGELFLAPFTFIWVNFGGVITNAWNGFCTIVSTGIQAISDVITVVGGAISATWNVIWGAISSFLSTIWNAIYTTVSTIITNVSNVISSVVSAIVTYWQYQWNIISTTARTVWNLIVSVVTTGINTAKGIISSVVNTISSIWSSVWNTISSVASSIWNGITTTVSGAINRVKSVITSVANGISSFWSGVWNGISSTVSGVWNSITSTVSGAVNGVKNSVSNAFNAVRDTISNVMDRAKSIVSSAIERIKGLFNFKLSFPPIKLPHFTVEGSFSLNPPSVPHLGLSWYAKGGMFNGPSVIGVGEAGPEYALPLNRRTLNPLSAGIAETLEGQMANRRVEELLLLILEQLRSGATFNLNEREFARLVWKVQQ